MKDDSQTVSESKRWEYISVQNVNRLTDCYYNNPIDINAGKSFLRVVEDFLPRGHSLLDIGCGSGYIAINLHDIGYRVKGIDISEKMISKFKQYSGERNIPVRLLNIFDLQIEELYDAVTARYVFGHYHDFSCLLSTISKHVNANGLIIFDSIASESIEKFRHFPETKKWIDKHLRFHFSNDELSSACEGLGLSIVARRPAHFYYNNPLILSLVDSFEKYNEELIEFSKNEDVFKFITWFETSISKHIPLEFYGHTINVLRKNDSATV